MPYRRDIDGLRALAVIPVVLCHAKIAGFSGGFVGVDVFFVISGYLITKIIAGELAEGRFSLLSFYERRARRILPALVTMVAATLVIGWFMLMPAELKRLGRSAFAAALFASNIHFARALDYFEPVAEVEPLLHTWSLAVEEQFYLLFPLLLMTLAALGRSRWMLAAIAAGSALSLAAAAVLIDAQPEAVFFLIPFRAWELGTGALLALAALPPPRRRALREVVASAGLLGIVAPVVAYTADTPFPGPAAVPPVLGAAALIWVGSDERGSFVTRLLALRGMVAVGLISYSLYLWHWPILAYLRLLDGTSHLSSWVTASALALTLGIAWLSYRFVELPFRRRRAADQAAPSGPWYRPTALALAATALAVPGLAGEALYRADGVPGRLPPDARRIVEAGKDFNPDRHFCMARSPQTGLCPIGATAPADRPPSFLLWGDSHAEMLRAGLDAAARDAGRSGFFAGKLGCVPILDIERSPRRTDCRPFNAAVWAWLEARPEIELVILDARWTPFVEGTGIGVERGNSFGWRWIGSPDRAPATRTNATLMEAGLAAMVDRLVASGRRVVIVGPVPEPGYRVPLDTARRLVMGWEPRPDVPIGAHRARSGRTEQLLRRVAARSPDVAYLALADLFCDARACRSRTAAGTPLYIDDDHTTRTTARTLLRPRLDSIWSSVPVPAAAQAPSGHAQAARPGG